MTFSVIICSGVYIQRRKVIFEERRDNCQILSLSSLSLNVAGKWQFKTYVDAGSYQTCENIDKHVLNEKKMCKKEINFLLK